MALTFDTLAYAHTLEDAGIPRNMAEAHARAARDQIMRDIATRDEIRGMLRETKQEIIIGVGSMIFAAVGILIAAMAFIAGA